MDEKLILIANERMLASKAYVLFMVNQDGGMGVVADEKSLNVAETYGLNSYIRGFDRSYINQPNI